LVQARNLAEEALALARERDDTRGTAVALSNLGIAFLQGGDLAQARAYMEEATALARELGFDMYGWALSYLGLIEARQGDTPPARAHLSESLRRAYNYGAPTGIMESLLFLGHLALAENQMARAARLVGAADALYESLGVNRSAPDLEDYQTLVAAIRAALNDEVYESEYAAGRAMTTDEAVDYALAFPD
jgi:ATP/maltotriose-dependent transcriptional regulator MalT